MKLLFFDLETTGTQSDKHGIHQLSGMIVINGEVKEKFDLRVQPHAGAIIEQGALDVAGVTLEQIQAYPAMPVVFGQFINLLSKYADRYDKSDKFFLAGYNNGRLTISSSARGLDTMETSISAHGSGRTALT